MSRTYRRKKKTDLRFKYRVCNQDWVVFKPTGDLLWPNGLVTYDTQSDYYKKQSVYFHRDGVFSESRHKALRQESNEKMRANASRQLRKVYRLEDYEDFEFDRSADLLVKQLWWSYF